MSGSSKTQKLKGEWKDTQIAMLQWVRKTLAGLEVSTKASDIRDMVDAYIKMDKLIEATPGGMEEKGADKTVADASKQIRAAMKRLDTTALFGGGDSGDDDDEED